MGGGGLEVATGGVELAVPNVPVRVRQRPPRPLPPRQDHLGRNLTGSEYQCAVSTGYGRWKPRLSWSRRRRSGTVPSGGWGGGGRGAPASALPLTGIPDCALPTNDVSGGSGGLRGGFRVGRGGGNWQVQPPWTLRTGATRRSQQAPARRRPPLGMWVYPCTQYDLLAVGGGGATVGAEKLH